MISSPQAHSESNLLPLDGQLDWDLASHWRDILANVPKLLLLINKIRRAIGKLDPGIARILSDLVTTIQNLLSRWPEKADGGITEQIQGILTQPKQAFQDAAGRLRKSSAKNQPADSPTPKPDSPKPDSPKPDSPKPNDNSPPPKGEKKGNDPSNTEGEHKANKSDIQAKQLPELSSIVRSQNPSRVTFESTEVRAVKDLSHLTLEVLMEMRVRGNAGKMPDGRIIQLHHLGQENTGVLVEMPATAHSIHHRVQHPKGNRKGAGLSPEVRRQFDEFRKRYWKARAMDELLRRETS